MNYPIIPQSTNPDNFHVYYFNGIPIRARKSSDGTATFIAADVCKAIGIANTTQALARLDDDEKGIISNDTGSMLYVTEAGLYNLILSSRKEGAKDFKRWVTHDVLPAIRETGTYIQKEMTPAEYLVAQAQRMLDHERQLADHDTRIAQLESGQVAEYFTILGYFVHIERPPPMIDVARTLGKRATALSHTLGYEVRKVPDERHGEVGSYHRDVLSQLIK